MKTRMKIVCVFFILFSYTRLAYSTENCFLTLPYKHYTSSYEYGKMPEINVPKNSVITISFGNLKKVGLTSPIKGNHNKIRSGRFKVNGEANEHDGCGNRKEKKVENSYYQEELIRDNISLYEGQIIFGVLSNNKRYILNPLEEDSMKVCKSEAEKFSGGKYNWKGEAGFFFIGFNFSKMFIDGMSRYAGKEWPVVCVKVSPAL